MFPCRTKYLINVHYLITEAHDVFSYIPSQIHFISEIKCLSFEAVWYSEVYRHGFSWFIALPQRGDVRILRRSSHLRSILGRLLKHRLQRRRNLRRWSFASSIVGNALRILPVPSTNAKPHALWSWPWGSSRPCFPHWNPPLRKCSRAVLSISLPVHAARRAMLAKPADIYRSA